jgi:2-methylcitrate dehydratase PrpD
MQKVNVVVHPEIEQSPPPAIVHIRLKDGKEYTKRVDIATGNPEKPLSLDQMIEKFRSCADTMIHRKKIDESIDLILHLEKLTDITKLIALIVQSKSIGKKEASNG